MKTRVLLFVVLCVASVRPMNAQVLISDSLLASYTIDELNDQGIANADNAIEAYRLIYHTIDPFGQPTIASGAVIIPVGSSCTHAMAAYMHGTILNREDVPSRLNSEIVVAYYLGAFRYVAVLPDYLGLGDSPGPHPYMHAASEASASVDMLRAAREFCAQKGVALNGQLFLTGYSQGGHVCMATHKMIEEQFPEEFQVTASAPCSGPYDASGVQAEVIVAEEPYPAPYYLPYVLFSYKYVYPWLYDDVHEILVEPYATLLPPLFLGNNGSGVVDDVMPVVPNDILVETMLQEFITDPEHPFREALRENDLYDWTPAARVRMFYCDADDHVFYQNSTVALQAMLDNGAADVDAINAGAGLDHNGCAFPALLNAKGVFDALQSPCSGIGVPEIDRITWSLWPNPASDRIDLVVSHDVLTKVPWNLWTMDGRLSASGTISSTGDRATIMFDGRSSGAYLLELAPPQGPVRLRVDLVR